MMAREDATLRVCYSTISIHIISRLPLALGTVGPGSISMVYHDR